jgi:uncharacterized cupin superfamily protein
METLPTRSAGDENGWQPFDSLDYKAIEGDPDLHFLALREQDSGVLFTGFVSAQPSKFELFMPFNETICVLEGELRVELEDGSSADVGPGDSVALPKGTLVTWTIKSPLKEFAVLTD